MSWRDIFVSHLVDELIGKLHFYAGDEIDMWGFKEQFDHLSNNFHLADEHLGKLIGKLDEIGMWSFQKEVDPLCNTLSAIQKVVEDAENKQVTSIDLNNWLRKLKDVVYDADDIVDELTTIALRVKLERSIPETSKIKEVSRFLSSLCYKNVVIKPKIEFKIMKVQLRLHDIVEQQRQFNLRILEGGRSVKVIERPKTGSLIDESEVIGRDYEKEELIQILTTDDDTGKNISVLPIVGMGGSGKTTFAKFLYNDTLIKNHFEIRAWVCVSDFFDVARITKDIIESATKAGCDESMGVYQLQNKLSVILRGKKFIIVLDDVWNENISEWENLCLPLKDGARGSKIIVTTRSERAAQMMGTVLPYKVDLLSLKDSWILFERMAFGGEIWEAPPTLVYIGKQIVQKCGGLPLAIKAMGALLSSNRDENRWNNILLKIDGTILPERAIDDIQPALRLSYSLLPTNLKQCFAYCALFPSGHEFDKDELVKLWMGEGYIHPREGIKMEEVGNELFDGLLKRSFFQFSSDKNRYIMHDLLHDLAEYVSSGEHCQWRLNYINLDLPEFGRHASFICDNEGASLINFDKLHTYRAAHRLRTIHVLHANRLNCKVTIPCDFFLKLRFLRVLNLSFCSITELPDNIGNLILLRYLDLSHTLIQNLPESIATLHLLQTCKLDHCYQLIKLPLKISNLVNLRHLTFPAFSEMKLTSMPADTGKLTSLQTLSGFVVGREVGCRIGELKNLMDLSGKFYISRLNNVLRGEDAEEASLKNKSHLFELNLEWDYSDDKLRDADFDEKVLAGLEPHPSLRMLSVCHYQGGKFPSWLSVLSNLVSIKLYNCRGCLSLPPLGQLHDLRHLCIDGMDRLKQLGRDFYGYGDVLGFQSLEQLELSWMFNLEEWFEIKGAMPKLQQLRIRYCPKLRQLPNSLSTLMKLEIEYCERLFSLPSLPSISKLVLSNCNEEILSSITRLTSLSSLTTDKFLKLLEGWVWPLPHLKKLKVRHFPEMLLPNGVRLQLPSLKTLVFENCHELQSLQNVDLPTTLAHLKFICCDNLKLLPTGLEHPAIHILLQDCPNADYPQSSNILVVEDMY